MYVRSRAFTIYDPTKGGASAVDSHCAKKLHQIATTCLNDPDGPFPANADATVLLTSDKETNRPIPIIFSFVCDIWSLEPS